MEFVVRLFYSSFLSLYFQDCLNNSNSLFPEDRLFSISSSDFQFSDALCDCFKIPNLSLLHNYCDDLSPFVNADLGSDSSSWFHAEFYRSIKVPTSPIRTVWDKFCLDVLRPIFPNEKSLIFQALPNLRIQVPGALAVHRWHTDSDPDHRHPLGEINAILALTDMFETNSVWRESSCGANDFKPFLLRPYDLVFWNGNTCTHGNKTNITDFTRVSLNFRVIPQSAYRVNVLESNTLRSSVTTSSKFQIGSYYTQL